MDIVNEIFDTFIGDHLYAWLLPATPGSYDALSAKNSSTPGFLDCHYESATKYFSFTPSQAACMSAWPRDYIYRQAINLFFIPWSVYQLSL
jgi:Delta7-sterol 5-desaturase